MSRGRLSVRRLARGACGFVFFLAVWDVFARSGMFSPVLTPPFSDVLRTTSTLVRDGALLHHAAATLVRLCVGLALSFLVSVPIGLLMGRYAFAANFFKPLVSMLMPIPSLVWVPLFVLWFGVGDFPAVLVVVYAASFPLIYNVWTGVRTVKPIWIRSATAMGASQAKLFPMVILPATVPYLIAGSRLAFSRAWIAVIGGELLASPEWGLGRLIFDAKEYLQADVMLSGLLAIGLFGLLFERMVFEALERRTIVRWGMGATPR
jgi:NitT/TauT family transport system permease protein